MGHNVVVTGMGLVTPLGRSPQEVLDRMAQGDSGASPLPFDAGPLACPLCSTVADFDAEEFFPDNKTLRLMNRDAQMAVVAARLATRDAALGPDRPYPSERIALFGATGLAGLPAREVVRLARYSAGADGSLDLARFGQVALRRVRPVLSFKILSNMPICFVSIFENIRGENAVYTPWEGQGAQAIAAGIGAIRRGGADCALVGGCDVKTHEFSLMSLQQLGALASWQEHGQGSVPGEGAAFLVLEDEEHARKRGVRIYCRFRQASFRTVAAGRPHRESASNVLSAVTVDDVRGVVAAGDGDVSIRDAESYAMDSVGLQANTLVRPKAHVGDLFAAAAALQVALAAALSSRGESAGTVLANCFGFGSIQSAFLLERP